MWRNSYLNKDSEEDDCDGGGDEERLSADCIGQSEGQSEGNGPPQSSVAQTKLIFHVEGDGAERVNDLS